MSVHVSAGVWNLRGLSPTERLVLLRMADWAWHSGWIERLSYDRLAADCELTKRTIVPIVHQLIAKGHLQIALPATGRRTARYMIAGDLAAAVAQRSGETASPLQPTELKPVEVKTAHVEVKTAHVEVKTDHPSRDPVYPGKNRARARAKSTGADAPGFSRTKKTEFTASQLKEADHHYSQLGWCRHEPPHSNRDSCVRVLAAEIAEHRKRRSA